MANEMQKNGSSDGDVDEDEGQDGKTYLGVLEPHSPPGLCSCGFEVLPYD